MQAQLSLFESSLNSSARLKEAMREALRSTKFSREQMADRMNELCRRDGILTGRAEKITSAMIDAWTAESKNHLPPAQLLPVFCRAAETILPIQVLAACMGARVIGEEDARLLEWARAEMEIRKKKKNIKRLALEAGVE